MKAQSARSVSVIEPLESRTHLSASANAKGGPAAPPPIRLDLVALHEFGHALGLDHTNDTSSIMYPYYNANYDLANFANDSAVATLRAIYSSANVSADATPWKDDLDGTPNDGVVTVTYSFIRDGTKLDQGNSNTFASLDATFGAGKWEPIFTAQLNRWASVSGGTLSFRGFDPDAIENATYAQGASGLAQNDPKFGDIRIATHRFDGDGKTLAHTYFPPPNGGTTAGDAHFDFAENWIPAPSTTTTTSSTQTHGSNGNKSNASTFSSSSLIHSLDASSDDLLFL